MANDIKLSITLQNSVTAAIKRIQKKLDNLPQEAYKEFVKDTPVRSGNARRNTVLQNDTIHANYQYAKKLDEGHSSQSPNGMTEPTLAFLRKRLRQIMRGK
jgi:ABC-type nitrate/sulfonate/bicarbonate transport system substrate-binding protein